MESKLLDEIDQIELNTNQTITASESNDTTIFVAAIVLFLSLVIVVSGYLLIYNIMYISVNHNIRFYGMLKTIGTTSRQIRKIVRTQALRISVYGIPIGILLGIAVSFAGMPFVVKRFRPLFIQRCRQPFHSIPDLHRNDYICRSYHSHQLPKAGEICRKYYTCGGIELYRNKR